MTTPSPAVRRGITSALTTLALFVLALLPSRLAVAMRVRGGSSFERLSRAFAGTTLDLSAVLLPLACVLLLAVVLTAIAPRAKHWWQHLGAPLLAIPLCVALYLVTVMEQEVKAERGAFTTMHEIIEGLGQSSFVKGSLDFIHYERIWMPAVVCSGLALLLMINRVRAARRSEVVPWRGWAAGFVGALLISLFAVPAAVAAQGALSSRLGPAGLGDPLSSLIETTADVVQHREPLSPAALLLQQPFTEDDVRTGAARLGWPPRPPRGTPCAPHPHARPLDRSQEPAAKGAALLTALENLSSLLFEDPSVAVFEFSLEGFRADDIHSLHDAAPEELHPFFNALYAGKPGVLASRQMYQAGVRTAQGLAAMTCGLGALPYNLSIIRDFEKFPMRCAPDVLAEAGFAGRFLYGSDPSFDGMGTFVQSHGLREVVTQEQLPAGLPTGAWGGLTDFVVFDEAVKRAAQTTGPQFSLVMSLSNHSSYTAPEDLPAFVPERVDRALARVPNRAHVDDRRRLVANSYVDAALERFFGKLDETKLSERAIVVLLADHSTGEDYVWGPDSVEHETDDAKAKIPFLIVIPEAFLARVKDRAALEESLRVAQRELEAQPLSQNDVPALLLALLSAHPNVKALPAASRWHTLGGQVTSPWFEAGGDPASFVIGINGVDQLYAIDRNGVRVGDYEDAIFLRTRAERSTVTPRLIPVAATVVETLRTPVCPRGVEDPSPPSLGKD